MITETQIFLKASDMENPIETVLNQTLPIFQNISIGVKHLTDRSMSEPGFNREPVNKGITSTRLQITKGSSSITNLNKNCDNRIKNADNDLKNDKIRDGDSKNATCGSKQTDLIRFNSVEKKVPNSDDKTVSAMNAEERMQFYKYEIAIRAGLS